MGVPYQRACGPVGRLLQPRHKRSLFASPAPVAGFLGPGACPPLSRWGGPHSACCKKDSLGLTPAVDCLKTRASDLSVPIALRDLLLLWDPSHSGNGFCLGNWHGFLFLSYFYLLQSKKRGPNPSGPNLFMDMDRESISSGVLLRVQALLGVHAWALAAAQACCALKLSPFRTRLGLQSGSLRVPRSRSFKLKQHRSWGHTKQHSSIEKDQPSMRMKGP